MKVKELIEKLAAMPPDADISVATIGQDYETGEYVSEADLEQVLVTPGLSVILCSEGMHLWKTDLELDGFPNIKPSLPPAGSC